MKIISPDVESLEQYFPCVIYGSVELVRAGMHPSLINDVDLCVDRIETMSRVRKFLIDNKWKETSPETKDEYGTVRTGSRIFVKDGYLPLHFTINNGLPKQEISEIIRDKIKRGWSNDYVQIINYCNHKLKMINSDFVPEKTVKP